MRVLYLNRKWLFVLWIVLGIILALLYIAKIQEDSNFLATFDSPAYGKVVVIDAGHGGVDPGAVSPNGTREDEINLKIAKKLQAYLEKEGTRVIMTRETDDGLYGDEGTLSQKKREDMRRRVQIIRDSGADVVVSIHLNKFSQPQYYGAQTFYMKGSEEGKKFAQCIQEQLLRILNRGNTRQIKAADQFLILKASSVPSVIVECGFLSNAQEERLLKTDDYQEKVAWAIYSGIISYFAEE